MHSYSLAAYEISVRERGNDELARVGKFGPKLDLFEIFKEFLTTLSVKDEEEQRVFRIRVLDEAGRTLLGVLESGNYGSEIPVCDIETLKDTYTIRTTGAPMKRFFFRLDVPTDARRAILLLQREGNIGVQDAFTRAFKPVFTASCPGFICDFMPLTPSEVIKHFRDPEKIQKVRFIARTIPDNFFKFFDAGIKDVPGYVEVSFNAYRDASLPWKVHLDKALTDPEAAPKMLALEGLQADEVKVQVKVGNSIRTINVNNLADLRATFEITDESQERHGWACDLRVAESSG